MSDAREYISNLDMPEKITLFKELYNELAGYGIEGDTELAHVNTFEASLLKSLGGSGTINDITNLREYKGGGQQQAAPPAQQSVTQTSEFPTELKPFISDVLGEGKAEFQREKGEGFQAFPGPQIAQFTPEQQAAFAAGREQFTGLAGTPLAEAATYYQPALAATALGTAEIGTEDIQRRMDPFLQNVVDIAKREARTDEDIARQQRAAQAVAGQGFLGGTRPAFVEAQAGQDLAERLGDIQARGLSASFQQAQQAAEQQRAREMTGGRQFAALGDTTGARARGDIAGLAGIGETQQQRSQQALDIAQREFEQEKAFPQTALQRYASLIRGFPLQATQQRFSTQTVPTPSLAQTLVGGLGTGAGLYGAFGGFNPRAEGGLVALQQGGLPGAQIAMGNVGGANVSPAAAPMQRTMPTPQDVEKAMELLRQRGKAIRQMSLPQVPQTTLASQIPPQSLSGVLPAAEGGLMSVVRRDTGSLVRGESLPKGAFGPDGYSGLQALQQMESFDSSQFPGAADRMSQAERDKKLNIPYPENKKVIKEIIEQRNNTNDPQEVNRLTLLLDNLMKAGEGVKTAHEKYSEIMGDRDKELLEAIGEMPEYYEGRRDDLSERRKREQFGNIAQFFARLGTDVSPAAQVGGLSGLAGAGVSALKETIPEVLETEAKFDEQEDVVSDKLFDSNIKYLSASKDVGKEEFERGTAQAMTTFEMARLAADLGVDMQEAENDRKAALNSLDHSDSAEIRKIMAQNFNVAMTAEGVWMFGTQPMSAEQRLQMNEVETTAALILRQNGGDYADLRLRITPDVEAVLNNNYTFMKDRTGDAEEVTEIEDIQTGDDASEEERVDLTTGSKKSIVDQVY